MKKILFLFLMVSLRGLCQLPVTDTLFGNNGEIFSTTLGGTSGISTNIFRQPDDKILLCGYTYGVGNNYHNVMFRTDCAGKIDSSFGVNGLVRHRFEEKNKASNYALLDNGQIAAVGVQAISMGSVDQLPFIARYNGDGTPDVTFGNGGSTKLSTNTKELSSVYQLSGGKLLATGGLFIARFENSGNLDLTFGTNGTINIPNPTGFTPTPLTGYRKANSIMRPDGKIISVMPSYLAGVGDYYASFICYNTDGIVDSTYGVNGFFKDNNFAIPNNPPKLMAQSNSKVIAALEYMFEDKIVVARYRANGTLDNTFGVSGYANIVSANPPIQLKYASKYVDDSYLIGYSEDYGPIQFKKFTANGVEVLTFSINGSDTFQFGNNLAETPDAGITSSNNEIIMGSMSGYNNCRAALTRFVAAPYKPVLTQVGNTLYSNVTNTGATFQWLFNGVEIADSTGSSISAVQDGNYSVIVTNSWGCEQSDDFLVNGVISGISGTTLNPLSVYPNPATSVVHLSWKENTPQTLVELLDISGRLILQQQLADVAQTNINVNQLAKGMYLLKVSTAELQQTIKISIE